MRRSGFQGYSKFFQGTIYNEGPWFCFEAYKSCLQYVYGSIIIRGKSEVKVMSIM